MGDRRETVEQAKGAVGMGDPEYRTGAVSGVDALSSGMLA
jgi:hypothetical protein